MSKQSKRRKANERKAKAIDKFLSQAQNNLQNSNPTPHSNPENGSRELEVVRGKRLVERPGFLAIVGTLLLGLAGFIQSYSHGWAIVVLLFALGTYLQAIRIEIEEHQKSKTVLNWVTILGLCFILSICMGLHVADMRNKQSINTANENINQRLSQETMRSKPTIEREITYYSRVAAARQWQPPELPPGLGDVPGGVGKMVSFKIGGNVFAAGVGTNGWLGMIPFVGPAGEDFIPFIQSNRVYIKVKTMFGTTEQTVEMNADWPTNIPNGWDGDRNFNANSFEIVDGNTQPVFQVRYDSPNAVEVNGIFVGPDGAVTIAFGDHLTQFRAGHSIPEMPERKAWFKYPSTEHIGELVDQ